MMNLTDYLERIQFRGTPRADLATLRALHTAHQYTVPFENLDVHLRRPVGLDIQANYEKIVRRRRGGWCYELNSVMGWALTQIGFDVLRLSGGVHRGHLGDAQLGNHLCLLVRLEEPWLVDVGFGGSLLEPFPLRALERRDEPYRLGLSETVDGYWRFTETAHGDPFTFDFRVMPADEPVLEAKCRFLQTDPASSFVQNLVVQRRRADTHVSLRGRILATLYSSGVERHVLDSAEEFVATLRVTFGLDLPEAATLWPAIMARHAELFGS
ncbi:MAG TPA: arylamine N-acetyltransferase [Steroidobacteraceae bacterium]|jgi:N-hydroxyarylamine O-acetyltransferase